MLVTNAGGRRLRRRGRTARPRAVACIRRHDRL